MVVIIRTSHVGSFPLDYSYENVERIVKDIYSIKLDAPPYPQLHNFIDIYLKPLEIKEYLYSRRGYYYIIKDKIDYISKININVQEAEDMINIIKKHSINFKWLRAPITGAFTLASKIYFSEDIDKGLASSCLNNKNLVLDIFSKFVKNIVKYMINLGFNIIVVDEPVFNYIIGRKKNLFDYKDEEIIQVLDYITEENSGVEYGVHICGKLNNKIIDIILQTKKIKYINIELHDSRLNIELIHKENLEKYDKYIAPGVVSAQKLSVESSDDILNILNLVYVKSGGRIDLVSGDCGFGGLKGLAGNREKEYEVAISKLRMIVDSVKKFLTLVKKSSVET